MGRLDPCGERWRCWDARLRVTSGEEARLDDLNVWRHRARLFVLGLLTEVVSHGAELFEGSRKLSPL